MVELVLYDLVVVVVLFLLFPLAVMGAVGGSRVAVSGIGGVVRLGRTIGVDEGRMQGGRQGLIELLLHNNFRRD